MMNSVMGAAGTNAAKIGTDVLHSKGIYYEGLVHLGNGAPLASMLWGCIAIFAIINKPLRGPLLPLWGAAGAVWGDPRAGGGLCRRQFADVRHRVSDDGRHVCGEACA
jgi:hypothetical protein